MSLQNNGIVIMTVLDCTWNVHQRCKFPLCQFQLGLKCTLTDGLCMGTKHTASSPTWITVFLNFTEKEVMKVRHSLKAIAAIYIITLLKCTSISPTISKYLFTSVTRNLSKIKAVLSGNFFSTTKKLWNLKCFESFNCWKSIMYITYMWDEYLSLSLIKQC